MQKISIRNEEFMDMLVVVCVMGVFTDTSS